MKRSFTSAVYLQSATATVSAVLEDFERYQDWVPGITSSRVLAKDQEQLVLELAGDRYPDRRFLFEVASSGVDGLSFREVGTYRRRGLGGRIALSGGAEGEGVTVEASVVVELPFFAGAARRAAVQHSLDEGLHALDLRSQKATLGTVPSGSLRREKILEIRRRGDDYELWFCGETRRLTMQPREDE